MKPKKMKKNNKKVNKTFFMLVFRDENLKVIKYEEDFADFKTAWNRRFEIRDSWVGEIVLCSGGSKEGILQAYPEYRMKTESSSS